MAAFLAMTSWHGEFTQVYFDQLPPDPAVFGMPSNDDGSRDDPLLSRPLLGGDGPAAELLGQQPTVFLATTAAS